MGSVSSIAALRSDPERLLNSGTGEAGLEVELLSSLRAITVPAGAKSTVWNALGVQVIGTSATAVASSGSWASAVWRGTVKVWATSKVAVAVPVVIAALGAGALHYHQSAVANFGSTSPVSSAGVIPPSAAHSVAEPVEPRDVTDDSSVAPLLGAPGRSVPRAPSRDHLREESALLERARTELRSGHPRAAQMTLIRLQARFPKGALTQEREVLLIEALAARGSSGAAARDARSFVAAHPESPHTVQLKRFLDRPGAGEAQPN